MKTKNIVKEQCLPRGKHINANQPTFKRKQVLTVLLPGSLPHLHQPALGPKHSLPTSDPQPGLSTVLVFADTS